jgi:hypothetical protein
MYVNGVVVASNDRASPLHAARSGEPDSLDNEHRLAGPDAQEPSRPRACRSHAIRLVRAVDFNSVRRQEVLVEGTIARKRTANAFTQFRRYVRDLVGDRSPIGHPHSFDSHGLPGLSEVEGEIAGRRHHLDRKQARAVMRPAFADLFAERGQAARPDREAPRTDERATPLLAMDKALLLEQADCVPDSDARRPVTLGQLRLRGNRLTYTKVAVSNPRPEIVSDLTIEGRSAASKRRSATRRGTGRARRRSDGRSVFLIPLR